eukprot:6199654-Pleurochrysis_carterae.AAC.1
MQRGMHHRHTSVKKVGNSSAGPSESPRWQARHTQPSPPWALRCACSCSARHLPFPTRGKCVSM